MTNLRACVVRVLALGIALLLNLQLQAQFTTVFKFQKTLEVPVQKADASFLENPWAGGMNACQFGQIDLNADQQADLVVFDRCGSRISTWLKTPGIGEGYTLSLDYKNCFPPLSQWMLMADYNNDGGADIFTYTNGGIAVYRNNLSNPPSWSLASPLLYSAYESGSVNLFALPSDYPAVYDLDNDGDLDILNFWTLGTWVDYHQNLSQELYGTSDNLVYQHQQRCWGHFAESESSAHIILNDPNCSSCSKSPEAPAQRHSGSSLFVDDLNGDGKCDLLLGDLDFGNLSALYNTASSVNALMTTIDSLYPMQDESVDLLSCPAVFKFVGDQNSQKQLLVSPSDPDWVKNCDINSVWHYQEDEAGIMRLQSKSFLQAAMLDMGSASFSVFWDYDSDGLMDLVLGSEGEMDSTWFEFGVRKTHRTSRLALYRNTGTPSTPSFKCVNDDLAGLKSLKLPHLYPAFADLDGDGLDEMLLGHADGSLNLYKQRDSASSIPQFAMLGPLPGVPMVDAYPTPIFYDLNADGLLDIVCGSQAGRLTYLENTGTQSQAYYSLKTNFLGAVDVTDPENPYYGYSVPAIFSYQSDTLLNVAAADGAIRCYGGLTANDGAVFTLFQPMLGQLDVGERCGAAIAYLNDDAWPDLLCGNLAGGYELFMGTQASAIGFDDGNDLSFSVCPNPSRGSFSLMGCGSLMGKQRLKLMDIFGKIHFEETLDLGFNQAHYCLNLHPGMYVVSLTNFSGKSLYAKMLVIE